MIRSGAVTPAWLRTRTRNSREPPSTSAGAAGPCTTLTRLSGLMATLSRTWAASKSSIRRTARPSSRSPIARFSAACSAAVSGCPSDASTDSTRRTCCASGCRATASIPSCDPAFPVASWARPCCCVPDAVRAIAATTVSARRERAWRVSEYMVTEPGMLPRHSARQGSRRSRVGRGASAPALRCG